MLECGMLERDARALQRCSAVLCRQLVVDELIIFLQMDNILTENMVERIMVGHYWYKDVSAFIQLNVKSIIFQIAAHIE